MFWSENLRSENVQFMCLDKKKPIKTTFITYLPEKKNEII